MFCLRWIISKSHKDIGIILIVFGAFNGILGTLLSILIRIEWSPGNVIFNSYFQMFNVVVTAHAFIMIFFMVLPILIGGYGNWFIPIKIGTPSITFFPRLNNLSFWLLPIFFILILVLCFIGWYYLGGVQVQSELDVIGAANTTVINGSNSVSGLDVIARADTGNDKSNNITVIKTHINSYLIIIVVLIIIHSYF